EVVGAAFVSGAPVRHDALFAGRFTRPFSLDWKPKFFTNPCELAPLPSDESRATSVESRATDQNPESSRSTVLQLPCAPLEPLALILQLVAERAELPLSAILDSSRMLGDLHLNSITVGQLVSEAARKLSLPRLTSLTDFANATVAEIANALATLK